MSLERQRNGLLSYLIHAANIWKVGRRILLGSDEYAVALCNGEINHIRFSLFGIDTVHFNDLHSVTFDPEILANKSANVDDAEHISLPRFNWGCSILGIINEIILGNGLCPSRIGHTHETGEKLRS